MRGDDMPAKKGYCPICKKRMYTAYIRKNKKRKIIGKYCDACGKFIPDIVKKEEIILKTDKSVPELEVKFDATILECPRCGHTWKYRGKSEYYTSCPKCHTKVKIPKVEDFFIIEYEA